MDPGASGASGASAVQSVVVGLSQGRESVTVLLLVVVGETVRERD